jgi:DNA-binding SARP family transcriptional activator
VEFVILGTTALYVDGRSVPLGAAKQRGMFALLLYHVGSPVRVDTLVEHLWGDQRRLDAHRSNLYALASRIRSVLNGVGVGDALLRVNGSGAYRLDVNPDMIDFHRFKHAVADARADAERQRHESAAALLGAAIELWRGEPLADLRGAYAEQLRQHMNDVLLEAHKLMADSQLRIGQYQSVLARLEPFMRAFDLDEALAQRWISALCAAGRKDDARAFYVAFRRRFRKEIRAEPVIALPFSSGRATLPAGFRVPPSGPVELVRSATVPRQLPKDVGDFVGHDDLLAELDSMAGPDCLGTNVVVLSGMPGVGKTTLAVHWAHLRSSRFPDGALYLNANAFGAGPGIESTTALGRFLNALGVPADHIPTSVEERRDQFNEILAGRRMMIVLDNVRDSGQARPLISTSDGCFTVITSRNRPRSLTVRQGIRCITVPSLPTVDSIALLRHTVGTPRAAAEPTAMQALARLSGGLPLALRIIGEHVAERPQVRIADLVGELSLHLLTSGSDDDETSLQSMFAWSYDALPSDAAHLFRTLGLFPGASISTEAAAAMLDIATPDAQDLLNILAKAHLINHDTLRRYRFHDLLRRYAADQAEREEPPDQQRKALRRLLDWYLLSAANAANALAPDQLPVPDLPTANQVRPQPFDNDLDAMRWSEAERANISALIHWATTHDFYRHGWQIACVVHEIYDRYGHPDELLELNQLAVLAAQLDGHQFGLMASLINTGATYFALHDYRPAAENFEAALALALSLGNEDAAAACRHNLGSIHLRTRNTAEAIRIYTAVLATCRATANSHGEGATLQRLGTACRQLGRYEDAIAYYHEALRIRERTGSLRGQGETHGELAAAYLETGQTELALEHCGLAIEIDSRTKDDAARCDALTTKADVERVLSRHQEAVQDAQCALAIGEEIGDPQRRCRALAVLADAFIASGKIDTARRLRTEALSVLDEIPGPEAGPLHERLADHI